MKIFKKAKKGFTLVELVVVIAVIAILSAVSVGAYFGITESANNSKLEQEAKQVHTAIQSVALAPNEIASLTKEGLKIEEAKISTFETELEKNLGMDITVTTGTVSTVTGVVVNLSTSAYSVSPAPGTPVVYKTFEYYNSEVGGKKAVADVVTGDCKVTTSTAENIPPQDPSEDEPADTPLYNDGWHLVTDVNELENDDQIIIASSYNEVNYAISTNQKSNNRGAAEITVVETTATLSDHVQPISIEINNGTYAFSTSKGYLSSDNSANRLLSNSEISDTSKWNVSIAEGVASITSLGTGRNVMQFNHDSEDNLLFACYASALEKYGQLSIYKNYGSPVTEVVPTMTSIRFKSNTDIDNIGTITSLNTQKELPSIQVVYNNGYYEDALEEDITWSSNDNAVISFHDGKFEVIGYAEKTVTISAKHNDIEETISFDVVVNVKEVVEGEDITYSHTFSSGDINYDEPTNLSGLTWTAASDNNVYTNFDNNNGKGFQFGSKNNPCKSLTLTTTSLVGKTIKSVTINTSGASSVSATFELKIDGNSKGSNEVSETATDYNFDSIDTICNESLAFVYTQTSSKALYIKSIIIKYC